MLAPKLPALLAATLVLALATSARAQDAEAGAKVFRSQCGICHSVQPNRNIIGPSLYGVVGRHSGRIPGFRYSQANLASGLVWDEPTLDRYLTSPRQVVPGTAMTYPGLRDDAARRDLIAFLASVH
jgi:cytochrome c2